MSVFHQNVRIGSMSIVSGFSAARQDVLPYSKGDGRPAAPVGINVIALKRRGVPLEVRTAVNSAFKILTSPEYNTTQALELIEAEFKGNKYVDNLVEFVRSSKRGCSLKRHKTTFGQDEE